MQALNELWYVAKWKIRMKEVVDKLEGDLS